MQTENGLRSIAKHGARKGKMMWGRARVILLLLASFIAVTCFQYWKACLRVDRDSK